MNEDVEKINSKHWRTSHLLFKDEGPVSVGAKTRRFSVRNALSRVYLGEIKWFGSFRKYCYFPVSGTVFDSWCLDQISDFCDMTNIAYAGSKPKIKKRKERERIRRKNRISFLTKMKERDSLKSIEGSAPLQDVQMVEGNQDNLTPLEVELGTITF
jgi:hypothetical protein